MTIRPLDEQTMANWFEFFDGRAFADHAPWKTCYCTHFFKPRLSGFGRERSRNRDYAEWLIRTGRMKGYLAYDGDRAVAWCNANDRTAFPALADLPPDGKTTKSIVCFIVENGYRRKGVATGLLSRVVDDARKDGYSFVEAFPKEETRSAFGSYRGPREMYRKAGLREEPIGQLLRVRLAL